MKTLFTFLITTIFWLLTYLILVPISWFVVAYKLKKGWEGYDGWFGNSLYGKYGNKAMKAETPFQSWWFLAVRNPISNFGKEVVSVSVDKKWPWHYDYSLTFGWKWGWKVNKDPVKNPTRTFVYRPYVRFVNESEKDAK
jgi:hypothetical protein